MDLVDRVRARCHEVGECWEWQGSFAGTCTPRMKLPGSVPMGVRRALMLHMGVTLDGRTATVSCGNYRCVNPEHLQALTRSALSRRVSKTRVDFSSVARSMKIAMTKRRKALKLTERQAAEIRSAVGVTQRELARQYGVCQRTVQAIRAGELWRDYSNPFLQLMR